MKQLKLSWAPFGPVGRMKSISSVLVCSSCLAISSPHSLLFSSHFQLVNNPLASQAAAAAAAAAMGSIASSQAFGNALSGLQGVTGQLVTNAQGQVSGRWRERVNSYGILILG